jgi:putative sterol carrier protein
VITNCVINVPVIFSLCIAIFIPFDIYAITSYSVQQYGFLEGGFMAIKFLTEDWIISLKEQINGSAAYREAAKDWEGDFHFIIEPEDSLTNQTIYYMDLWHGECRSSSLVGDVTDKTPEFVIMAPLSKWRKVIEKKLDPIQGMVTRQLKLKGNLMKIMKTPKAALELVNCCTLIETEFPG